MPDLKNKFLYQSALAVSQLLFPLITYPWLTRTLGPEGLGKTSYIEFTAGLIFTIFSIGISYYGVREISKERNNTERRSQLTSQLLSLHLISMLAGIAVFLIILFTNKNFSSEKELILLGCIYLLVQVFALEWYMQGMEKFRFIAIRNILIRLAGIVCILLLVRKKEDYIIYFGIVTATMVTVSLLAAFHVVRENKISLFKNSFRQHIKPLSWFFLTTSFISIYVFFDTLILGFLTDDKTVGYYTIAIRIVKLPLLFLLVFNTVLFPRIAFLKNDNRNDEIKKYNTLSLEFIFTCTLPLCLSAYILSPEIIQVIAGPGFTPSVKVIQILAALPLIICISNFLVLQLLIPSQQEKKIVWAVMAGSICSIVLLFFLIPGLKESGAAYATLATEFLVMAICLFFSWAEIKKAIPVKTILFSLLFSGVAVPAAYIARHLSLSAIWALISSLAVTGTAYFILQYFVASNRIVLEIFQFIKNPFRKKMA